MPLMMPFNNRNEKSALPISPASSNTMSSSFDGYQQSPIQAIGPNVSSHQPQYRGPNGTSSSAIGPSELSITEKKANSTSAGISGKKRRSRKGLGKRFDCSVEGCGRSYSRAEHLHMDRHATKGSQAGQRFPSSTATVPHAVRSEYASPIFEAPSVTNVSACYHTQNQYVPPQEQSQSPYTAVGVATPSGKTNNHSASTMSASHGSYRGVDTQSSCHVVSQGTFSSLSGELTPPPGSDTDQCYHGQAQRNMSSQPPTYTSHPQSLQLDMSDAQYPSSNRDLTSHALGQGNNGRDSADYRSIPHHSTDLFALDQMALPIAGPVFGNDGGLSRPPYVGMPEDFMAYLFNSLPSQDSPPEHGLQGPGSNYGELQDTQYSTPFTVDGMAQVGHFPSASQHIMSVTNLLDENSPETNISEERSQEIFDFIKDRFHEHDVPSPERSRGNILEGDREQDDHMLSRRMMQAYLGSYWYHFSDQLPILHRPTFSSDKTPNLLLLAMMTIGAACLDRTHGQQVLTAGAKLSNFIARHLRWEVFMDTSFRPPAKLWVFQTLILLELYEKMFSTRELHERAHIHHATMITLMRRGRSLIGKPPLDSPPNLRGTPNGSKLAQGVGHTPEEWWNHWVTNEATRRAAFAAFIIDSTHATMFGHSAVMVTHEMRLPLPYDESLWRARSSAEVGRAEASLNARGIQPISFLEGLKRTLSHQEVKTTSLGRTALMAGLMSVTYHMQQRDLQVNVLGGGAIQALGSRDKWRASLARAYDSWKSDFDRELQDSEPSSDPYGRGSTRNEAHIVFGSRMVLHHLAHMAMHADIVDCQMFAHAKRLLGRTIGAQEFSSAQKRVKEQWAPSAKARGATFYALKFLKSVMLPDGAAFMDTAGPWPEGFYETRYDVLMNRPWVLYFAALVVWCYGYALEGPCGDISRHNDPDQNQQQMRHFLLRYASISDPNELQVMRGINNNTALLVVLRDSFDNTRWDLLHEGARLMSNCITLNKGGTV
ncbi:C2H2 finger domain protein [Metarhizium rileyi]|uniref:C2H2 finger domain protein n=1 Tax=Metarhizium rileyi (strain RCEF 4871) TaxID=1649241 RepID=A0A167H861_METRR|nr:C2H2 finger domain protein [Metarhizium rileyi RCEF 4871]